MRRILSWAFIRGPARFYVFADESGASTLFSLLTLLALAVSAGIGAGVGALIGLLTAGSVGDAAFTGLMIGLGAFVAWIVWSLVLVAILWIRGVAPSAVGKPAQGKQAAGWRRPGEPLIPSGLVAFFALMTVLGAVGSTYSWYRSRPLPSPVTVVDGRVAEIREPSWYDRGSGSVIVRYDVSGTNHVIETRRDPGDRFLQLDDVVPVEYSEPKPAEGRSVWAIEERREDHRYLRFGALLCAALGLLSAAGWGVGRWRSRE